MMLSEEEVLKYYYDEYEDRELEKRIKWNKRISSILYVVYFGVCDMEFVFYGFFFAARIALFQHDVKKIIAGWHVFCLWYNGILVFGLMNHEF